MIRFRTGLRLEQMTAYLQARPDEIATLEMDAADFLALVRKPPAKLLADYPWLDLPKGATLEGYLAAGDYRVLPDTTPDELVRKMLDRFYEDVGPARIDAAQAGGRSFHEVADPRLARGAGDPPRGREGARRGRLPEPDRPGQHAQRRSDRDLGGRHSSRSRELGLAKWPQYSFWNVPAEPMASIEFPKAIAGYQTYLVRGLFPGPLCTPTVSSIDAALAPDTKKRYLYFVAIPGGDGAHDFSRTYDEHLQKLRKYGYTHEPQAMSRATRRRLPTPADFAAAALGPSAAGLGGGGSGRPSRAAGPAPRAARRGRPGRLLRSSPRGDPLPRRRRPRRGRGEGRRPLRPLPGDRATRSSSWPTRGTRSRRGARRRGARGGRHLRPAGPLAGARGLDRRAAGGGAGGRPSARAVGGPARRRSGRRAGPGGALDRRGPGRQGGCRGRADRRRRPRSPTGRSPRCCPRSARA